MSLDVINYLRTAFAQDQTSAVVSQNPDGTLIIAVDVGPGSSQVYNTALEGDTGEAGAAQGPLMLRPDIYTDPNDLPAGGVLTNTIADIGKFWMIAQFDDDGACISVGAYIWYGNQFRFLPFGSPGPRGAYPVIQPKVVLPGPNHNTLQEASVPGAGTINNPYLLTLDLSVPEGPQGESAALATFADFNSSVDSGVAPTVGQFITATDDTIMYQGRSIPVWELQNVGELPLLPFVVPQSAFYAKHGITFGTALANTIAGTITQLTGFLGSIPSDLQSALDEVAGVFSGGVNATISGVTTALNGLGTNVNNLLSALGLSSFIGSGVLNIAAAVQGFTASVTGPIQTALNAVATNLGIAINASVSAVAQGIALVVNPLNRLAAALENPSTISAFSIPPQKWAWKPIVFGQIRMFEVGLSFSPLQMGIEVRLGGPRGQLVARGFGNTLSGVVTVVPHCSAPSAPSLAMDPTASTVGWVPANHTGYQGTLWVNVVNDGIITIYDYNPSDAQLFVLACPATEYSALKTNVPAAVRPKMTLSYQSISVGA